MIIRQVKLLNFGIYSGEKTFDLAPVPLNGYNRPIVLFSGKNGAGKTTLVDAIRLCLHGSLAIGGRTSRTAYEDYLAKRVHVPPNGEDQPSLAKIELVLDYVSAGNKQAYRIERSWCLVQGSVKESLGIWEDGRELTDFDTLQQKESLLRELVSPQLSDLFFFDGEKLQLLAQDGTSNGLLADIIKTLFGLNMVEQLQKDLDIYLSRRILDHGADTLQTQFQKLNCKIADLEQRRLDLGIESQENKKATRKTEQAISKQKQRIAGEGEWFAEQLNDLKMIRQRLEIKIEMQRRQVQELSNGLMPFAIAPQMCQLVAERLHLEKECERGIASQQALENQVEQVHAQVTSPQFWDEAGIVAAEPARQEVSSRIEAILRQATPSPTINPQEIFLGVSEQDRQTLLTWVEQALDETPRKFCQTVNRLNLLEAQVEQIDRELALVPADELLKPLVETLHRLNQGLGRLQKVERDLDKRTRRVEYELEQAQYELRRLRQQIAEQERYDQQVQLAAKTQGMLDEYIQKLSREKLALLEKELVSRFNQLCHKESLIDTAEIDPNTFAITLYRQCQPFGRERLSAGEKQLLAVAIMWALRDVSGVPMPVIVDTPLGRLDREHRLRMIREYFPRASHQVILLTTDSEIDDQMLPQLAPAVSRIYHLDYDPVRGQTRVRKSIPVPEDLS